MKVRPTILRILRATFPCLMTFVLCSACGPSLGKSYDLYEAENTARYISVQHNETKKDGYHKVHVCLEPTGPANKLDEINIELSAQGTYAGTLNKRWDRSTRSPRLCSSATRHSIGYVRQ